MKNTILYVGIDPSINSTGITIARYENNVEVEIKFYIIKNGKLTKKELKAEKVEVAKKVKETVEKTVEKSLNEK